MTNRFLILGSRFERVRGAGGLTPKAGPRADPF
jgi:hypothetical protein